MNSGAGVRASVVVLLACIPAALAAPPAVEWKFGGQAGWCGWSPGGGIRDARSETDGMSFRSVGSDPLISGPLFELPAVTNHQWVEIDITTTGGGAGELFYTNKTTGQYSGFEPHWMSAVEIPGPGRHTVRVWPFWASLGKLIRLRFDPPSDADCRLHAIRIVSADEKAGPPEWDFTSSKESLWAPMCAARIRQSAGGMVVQATRPQAVIIVPVETFDAGTRSVLRLDADCLGESSLTLYWSTENEPGLVGQPIDLPGGTRKAQNGFDLRQFPIWTGRITHLALGFGSLGGETLTIRKLAIEKNDPQAPLCRVVDFHLPRPINRVGEKVRLFTGLECLAGAPRPDRRITLFTDDHVTCDRNVENLPGGLKPGELLQMGWDLVLKKPGLTTMRLDVDGQSFVRTLRVDEALPAKVTKPADYDVPVPRPVKTQYNIGIYYFPGWSRDDISRWRKQAGFPERDPVLGWYEEGKPEVADWHIKWAVENGLSFFVYDWYWRDGKESLGAGLNDGFLKARYRDMLKFGVMWANHKPFSGHTPQQLLQVTDYWVEHYFRRPNYLLVDGKPYVSFFVASELLALGSEEAVAKAFDAMRERVRAAGLPGLHIGACNGDPSQIKKMGFDSITAYNYPSAGAPAAQSAYRPYLLAHEDIWKKMQAANVLPYIPLLTVNWDSRPWAGPRAPARFLRNTAAFAEGLGRLKANLDARKEKMAILEAWNEWGEGSYLEPNAEFGFKDVEAVRATFAEPGDWPVNIGPADVDLDGKYDMRKEAAAKPGADSGKASGGTPASVIRLAGVNPAVASGIELTIRGNEIVVGSGEATLGGRVIKTAGGTVQVEPAEIRVMKDVDIKLVAGPVNSWHGGNRLIISPQDRRNLLPGSYVPGSLKIVLASSQNQAFAAPDDLVLDETWGAFAISEKSRLKPGDTVNATYQMSLRRVDVLLLAADGRPSLVKGEALADCPLVPQVPSGAVHLASIYRPFNATIVEPRQVLPIHGAAPDLSAIADDTLTPVLAKLKAGKEVTVVCWGDSVTACGESSSPATCYVGLIESMLKERFPQAKLKVINAGIGGTSTPGRLPGFQKEVLDFHPDVVTLEFINDMGLPPETMQKNYTEILQRTREIKSALILITPHFSMPAWMGFKGAYDADPRAGVAFLKRFAKENGIPLADASHRWEQLEAQGVPYEILLRNGINHPEDRGHRFFAEEVLRYFPR